MLSYIVGNPLIHPMKIVLLFLSFLSLALRAEKPNVVIIYADDVGWGDLSCYGSEKIPTPNLDKLAAEGVRFTDGHCGAATCSPSRYSLLTGEFAFRKKVSILAPNAPMAIKPDTFTMADLFLKAGYNTAVIGKWHLGLGDGVTPVNWNAEVKPGPLELGFQYSFLLPSTNDRVPCVYLDGHKVVGLDESDPLFVSKKPQGVKVTEYPDGRKNPEAMTYYKSTHGHNNSVINGIGRIGKMWGGKTALWNDEEMADVFLEKTRAYLKEEGRKSKPFFLYFSSQDIHVPRAPHKRFQGKTELGYRGDAMVQLDYTVGEIMAALEENGLRENTLVIFSSDNGPVYDDGYDDGTEVKKSEKEVDQGHDGSGPYRGGKYQIYEGGTRVPFIVSWPARVQPKVSDTTYSQVDLMGSFAELLEIDLEKNQAPDSRKHLPILLGESEEMTSVVKEAYSYGKKKGRGLKLALRFGDWKYIQTHYKGSIKTDDPSEEVLFNLASDIGEKVNLSEKEVEKRDEMKEKMTAIINK